MNDERFANKLSKEIDLMLKTKNIGVDNENKEYNDLLRLTKHMMELNFSSKSRTKGDLKKKLVKKFQNNGSHVDDELNDEDLDLVSGGIGTGIEIEEKNKD